MEPQITILMSVYNGERFLREAIDSILIQTFVNFEFLILDDGSTDSSGAIIKTYSDPRIRYVRNEKNIGLAESLNKGIALSNCELIARMDADDVAYPQRLQRQYDYMVKHPYCALLSSWARVVSEDKKFVRVERYRSEFYYYNLTFECWMYHPTVMVRKQPVTMLGGYVSQYSEDFDLFWRISSMFEIGNLAEVLLDYRVSNSSLHAVTKKLEYAAANEINVLRNIRHYLGEDYQIDQESLECLRHNFGPIAGRNDVDLVLSTLKVLDAITEKILTCKNPNLNETDIHLAHYYKRIFIIIEIGKLWTRQKAIELFIRTGSWMIIYRHGKYFFQSRVRKLFNLL
jgi:glycosyltransferase involved in cell wall biosynthesis